MSKTIASGVGPTNAWLAEQAMSSMKTLWSELAHIVEPPSADQHAAVVW